MLCLGTRHKYVVKRRFSFFQSLYISLSIKNGCIAQLAEHWAFNLMVAGSSPATPKQKIKDPRVREADRLVHLRCPRVFSSKTPLGVPEGDPRVLFCVNATYIIGNPCFY
jgi:hypothetical protein